MNQAISEPRKDLSSFAPRLTSLKIPVDMIGAVIGPGGKTIRHIVKESGAEVNIEEDGTVVIASVNKQSTDLAREMIERITEVPEVGKVYKATVRKIMDFGAFCEFLPGKEGLLHISQIDTRRVNKVSDVLKVGDVLDVRLLKIDEEGRFNLSRKVLLGPTHEKQEKREVVM
jgi:polyribonucleotide nucleotidyltransferase